MLTPALAPRLLPQLMEGHSNVARSVLSEELRLLDDDWQAEREEEREAEEERARARALAAQQLIDEATAHKEAALAAERAAKRALTDAQARAAAVAAQAEASAKATQAKAKAKAESMDAVDEWTDWALDVEESLERQSGSKASRRRAGAMRPERNPSWPRLEW